nr:NADH dehydrogenase subunit 3 [Degeeriella rufa]
MLGSLVAYWCSLCLIVSLVFVAIGCVFNEGRQFEDSASSFECGIDPIGSCRIPLALHFFLVAVVFVVFDAEMLLALPLICCPVGGFYWWFWPLFMLLLYVGLVVEFTMRTIDWKE